MESKIITFLAPYKSNLTGNEGVIKLYQFTSFFSTIVLEYLPKKKTYYLLVGPGPVGTLPLLDLRYPWRTQLKSSFIQENPMAFFQEPMLMAQKSPQTTCWIIQEKALPKNQLLRQVLGLKNDVSFQRRGWKSQIQTAEPAFSLGEVDKHPTKNNFSQRTRTKKTGQPLKKGPPRCPNNDPTTRGKKNSRTCIFASKPWKVLRCESL